MNSLWINDYHKIRERFNYGGASFSKFNKLVGYLRKTKSVKIASAAAHDIDAVLSIFRDYSGMDLVAYKSVLVQTLNIHPFPVPCIVLSSRRTLSYFKDHNPFPHLTTIFPPECVILIPRGSEGTYGPWLSQYFVRLSGGDGIQNLQHRTIIL